MQINRAVIAKSEGSTSALGNAMRALADWVDSDSLGKNIESVELVTERRGEELWVRLATDYGKPDAES